MALPSSGTITIEMIRAEFGGTTPVSLSQYYRGGGLVPNVSINNAIPTSGQISFSNFYGSSNSDLVPDTLTEFSIFASEIFSGSTGNETFPQTISGITGPITLSVTFSPQHDIDGGIGASSFAQISMISSTGASNTVTWSRTLSTNDTASKTMSLTFSSGHTIKFYGALSYTNGESAGNPVNGGSGFVTSGNLINTSSGNTILTTVSANMSARTDGGAG